jgi:hypothetical protein
MPYANPRLLPIDDAGHFLTTLCQYTRADYSAAGTTDPAVGDIVTFSATGDHYVKRAPDNQAVALGRVSKVEKLITGTDIGLLSVEWLDVERFVELQTDDFTTVTRGNRALKDGDTSVADNWDAPAASGSNFHVVAKGGTSGAGKFLAAVLAA